VRDVEALDPERCLLHPQRLLEIGERLRARDVVARPTRLVPDQRLLGVQSGRAHEVGALAAMRHGDLDLPAPAFAQPHLQLGSVVGKHRHEDAARHVLGLAVRLLEDLLHELPTRDVDLLLDRQSLSRYFAAAS